MRGRGMDIKMDDKLEWGAGIAGRETGREL